MKILRFSFLLICAIGLTLSASARQRPKAQMRNRAQSVLAQFGHKGGTAPQELKAVAGYSVFGYTDGGYVVLSTSDLLPEVLGYAPTRFADEGNRNFQWWLAQVDSIAAEAERTGTAPAATLRAPDTSRFPSSVPAMLTCQWGQEEPYWTLCPRDPLYGTCYTGCVATAMAQILYYHKFPPHGYGTRTITYPLNGENVKTTVTADFGNTTYDWAHMRDSYSGSYTQQEADAVATLMMHCGVAARMNYSTSGSGAYTGDAAAGLREYFGIKAARACRRSDYVDSDWMDMVYTELSEHRPILYGAVDMSNFGGGHAFVLDGYNAQGLFHVNWGWDGDADGYYDINILNPKTYRFADDQDMIIGIYGKQMELIEGNVHVAEPGTLAAYFEAEEALQYATLSVSGTLNGDDLRQLRYMAGRDAQGHTTTGNLHSLDLSAAHFVAGGSTFLAEGSTQYATSDGELPARAFYGCQALESLTLPAGLKRWGEGALAMCFKLQEVHIGTPAEDAEFYVDGDVVLTKDSTRVLAVLPSATGRLQVPMGVRSLGNYALAGCRNLTSLRLPSTLEQLGDYALYYCSGLTELRVYTLSVPAVGSNTFASVDPAKCQLAVRRDMLSAFRTTTGWNTFAQNAREFYTIIRPRNSTREYGDGNPVFGYTLEGDDVEGEPLLETDALQTSPVGRYVITASAGSITDEAVEYAEGTLIVRRAPLTLRPADCTIAQGEALPAFTLLYEGLKNEETEPGFTELPLISTTATSASPVGQYPITVTGGEAPNYNLSYAEGVLSITENSGILSPVLQADENFRDLQGRRVPVPSRGVFILNGRKMLIK
ncbi:MAG: C10 family peptidase [Alloprevotella sp.]|nr:C10 family peptidase [Alloprevotella sp.]